MSLKIIKIEPRLARVVFIAAAAAGLFFAWLFIKWNFANTMAYRMDTTQPGADRIADWLTQFSPTDPQTHLTAALIYERTLDAADLARSLAEYEAAAALSPNDYQRWLDLGRIRGLNGDTEGAAKAYTRAIELAPNYAVVQWAYGNLLIRSGDPEQGFALIAKAAAAKSEYAGPAVATAMQLYDGDAGSVRQALGDHDAINAVLAAMLASQNRFDEAVDVWSKLQDADKAEKFKRMGTSLLEQLVKAKRFRLAARVASDLWSGDGEKPTIGQVHNGGFERGVKLRNAALFEWQIADGAHPQIGLSEGQAHGGRYAMFALFNTFETAAFRDISQTVAVEPGVDYDFEIYYRSDLKTPASLKWEIADAGTLQTIAVTPPMVPASDWTSLRTTFTAPDDNDGVIIRMVREGCVGPACQMSGKVSFDDVSIRRL